MTSRDLSLQFEALSHQYAAQFRASHEPGELASALANARIAIVTIPIAGMRAGEVLMVWRRGKRLDGWHPRFGDRLRIGVEWFVREPGR